MSDEGIVMSYYPPPPQVPRVAPASSGRAPAPPGRRALAALVDGLLAGATAGLGAVLVQLGIRQDSMVLEVMGGGLLLAWLVGFVGLGVRYAGTGVSPGKRVAGLRLVSRDIGGAPGLGAAWGRFFLAGIGNLLVIGFVGAVVQILQDGDRRTWYDSMTDVQLIDDKRSSPTFDPRDVVEWGPTGGYDAAAPGGWAPPVTAPGGPDPSAPVSVFAPPPLAPPEQASAVGAPPPSPIAEQLSAVGLPLRVPGAPMPIDRLVPVRAMLTFASGELVEISGAGVLGRNPQPSGADAAIRIADTTRTLSKSHLAFVVEVAGLIVTDLHSTNGSTVIGLDGIRRVLGDGVPTLVEYGSTVTVGDLSFLVTRALADGADDGFVDFTMLRPPR